MTTTKSKIAIAAALLALPPIYFFPAVLGKVTLAPGDGWTQILGIRILIGQMIAQGEWPLWNPLIFAGMPLLASIQPGALYPPTWLFAVFSPQVAMNVMVITTYHIALIGTYLYARRIGATRVGALIAGFAFAFGGYMITHLGHTNRIAAASWLPWILLAIEELYQQARWRWVALGAIFIALQLYAGEPQMTFYTVLVAGAYGLFTFFLRPAVEGRFRFLASAAAMSICGALLSMIQLLPERELLKLGEREGIDYEYFSQFSFPPWQWFSLLFPYFFGGAATEPYRVPYWGLWNLTETCGYTGMMALLLTLTALIGGRRQRLVWFWAGCAAITLLLSFGSFLPYGIHKLLYNVPVYNLFRAQGRHLFEFTFAIGILAALGVTGLAQMERRAVRRVLIVSTGVLASLVAAGVIVYRFFDHRLKAELPVPPEAGALTNPDIFIPVVFFGLSAIALFVHARRWSALSGGVLAALLLCDLWSFGFSYEWRWIKYDVREKLSDPPTVKFIKEREPDLNVFRVASHSNDPYKENTDLINYPNISIARGLQSVNGYDPVRLWRTAQVAGTMTLDGYIMEANAFTTTHQGLNLLNAKYLLCERASTYDSGKTIEIEGVKFSEGPINLMMGRGTKTQVQTKATATELAIVSAMGRSGGIPTGSPVLKIHLHTMDGRVIEQELQAGRDTSEWAWDRPDVRASIKHTRAPVVETWDAGGFEGHRYLARLKFDRAEITNIDLIYNSPDQTNDADITIARASLYDAEIKASFPLDSLNLPLERWRKLERFGNVELYENLKAVPRAWIVPAISIMPSVEVLQAVKTGMMKDGAPFDPMQTVLLETEIFGNRKLDLPLWNPANLETGSNPTKAEAKVTRYEPHRIELQTRGAHAGLLVLSEIYYRGWEAWIDGKRTPVERVNYTLRGVMLPAGDHRVEFVFRAPSFRNGARYSLLGVILLLGGFVISRTGSGKRLLESASRAASRAPRVSRSRLLSIVAIVCLLIYGWVLIKHAARVVGGSDSSGYGSLARALPSWSIIKPVTELDQFGLSDEFTHTFIPLAYDVGPRPKTMAPFYPIGLPLQMSLGALVFGWKHGPFIIPPISAALGVLLIFLVSRELGLSRGFAIAGAVLLAANPTLIYMALQPMSDANAMFWSLLAIYASLRSRQNDKWSLLAGAAFGMAFLIRPTSALLLPAIFLSLRLKPKVLLYFCLGGLPLAGVFFAYNYAAYGNPLQTGYGAIGLYTALQFTGFTTRFKSYVSWMAITMGPVMLLGWLGSVFCRSVAWRDRAMVFAWFGCFFFFYCTYDIYGEWWYTRFLLPAYPALILGALLSTKELAGFLQRFVSEGKRAKVSGALLALLLIAGLLPAQYYDQKYEVFKIGRSESTYSDSCRWADRTMPAQALVVSMQMSGALDYYTDRSVVRWDWVTPEQWGVLKQRAAEKGYRWFALLHPHEIPDAQRRLPGKWNQVGEFKHVSLWQIEE